MLLNMNDSREVSAEDLCGETQVSPVLARLGAWLGRQSLPRIIGLFLGNTRDLENQLKAKDEQLTLLLKDKNERIIFLEEQVRFLSEHCKGIQDSYLISKGQLSSTPQNVSQPKQTETITKNAPIQTMAVNKEVMRLAEIMHYRPNDLNKELAPYETPRTPFEKEVHKLFYEYINRPEPPEEKGVIIT
jgi:hypothetical protein